MQSRVGNPETYVGDTFTLNFMKGDKSPVATYNGLKGTLIGFKPRVIPIMPHEVNAVVTEPGIYTTIGDPLIRLEVGAVVEVPMYNLIPVGFNFADRLPKNIHYLEETKKWRFVSELPHTPYNIGDKVLISQHSIYLTDFVSEILDVSFKGTGVYYVICPSDEVEEIRSDKIIDVVQRGEISEIEKLGLILKRTEPTIKQRLLYSQFSIPYELPN